MGSSLMQMLDNHFFFHSCCFCKTKRESRSSYKLVSVPLKARHHLFIQSGIIVPKRALCCQVHLEDGFVKAEDISSIPTLPTTQMTEPEIEALLQNLRELAQRKTLDFDTPGALSDEDYYSLTGLHTEQFKTVYTSISGSLRHTRGRSPRTCLGIFLMKARTGVSHTVLSALFGIARRTIGRAISSVRQHLMFSFVPLHLGVNHISREEVIQKHTSSVAKTIFTPDDDDKVMLVGDATYIYVQKSSNYGLQRRMFSMHKGRPLIKPMVIVTTSGYILDIFGPYLADGKNNDANILTAIMQAQQSRLKCWLKPGDVFIVDRGFRDCLDTLQEMGFETEMPAFLAKGNQHSTQEANESRLVTAVR